MKNGKIDIVTAIKDNVVVLENEDRVMMGKDVYYYLLESNIKELKLKIENNGLKIENNELKGENSRLKTILHQMAIELMAMLISENYENKVFSKVELN